MKNLLPSGWTPAQAVVLGALLWIGAQIPAFVWTFLAPIIQSGSARIGQ